MLHVYADESCKDGKRYLALGGIAVHRDAEARASAALAQVRARCKLIGEVKWTKTTRATLPLHMDFADVFFDACARKEMSFAGMYVDTHTFNHRRWNDGNAEIGFSKLIYQLLLHKFGRRFGQTHKLQVYLDSRETNHDPDGMRPMLNADLRRWGVRTEPFRRITFHDSHASHLLQVNDLLVGTIGYLKNGHHKAENRSQHKFDLARYICRRAMAVEPRGLRLMSANNFQVWAFQYKGS